jgi:hypothetical protein
MVSFKTFNLLIHKSYDVIRVNKINRGQHPDLTLSRMPHEQHIKDERKEIRRENFFL